MGHYPLTGPYVTLLIMGLILLHAGAFLLRLAWFPRRIGETPHCRSCGYILEGIDSDRCPECGQHVSPRTIVRGQRVRRPYLAAIACLLVLLGLTASILTLTDRFRAIDFYSYKPTGWVIADLRSADYAVRWEAWVALDGRMKQGKFDERHRDGLDEVAIQLRSSAGRLADAIREYLIERYPRLSASHEEELFNGVWSDLIADAISRHLSSGLEVIGTTATAYVAEKFLEKLIKRRLLSAGREQNLVELALNVLNSPKAISGVYVLKNFLSDQEFAGKLTPAQRERLLALRKSHRYN
jgi:hypothetical protein